MKITEKDLTNIVRKSIYRILTEVNDTQNFHSIKNADKCYGWDNLKDEKDKNKKDYFSRDYMIHGKV